MQGRQPYKIKCLEKYWEREGNPTYPSSEGLLPSSQRVIKDYKEIRSSPVTLLGSFAVKNNGRVCPGHKRCPEDAKPVPHWNTLPLTSQQSRKEKRIMCVKLNYTAVRPSLLQEISNGTAAKVSATQGLLQGPVTCHRNYLWAKHKSSFSDNLRARENSNVIQLPLKVPGIAPHLCLWNADLLMANLKGSLKTTESTPHIHYMRNRGSRRETVIWPWLHEESIAEKTLGFSWHSR